MTNVQNVASGIVVVAAYWSDGNDAFINTYPSQPNYKGTFNFDGSTHNLISQAGLESQTNGMVFLNNKLYTVMDEAATGMEIWVYDLTGSSGISCFDGIQNGSETAVDCGGTVCNPCITPIYDIQFTSALPNDASPLEGQVVSVKGIVTGIKPGEGFWIQDDESAWSGIYVYENTENPLRGDEISVTGLVFEYNSLTELKNISYYSLISQNNTVNPISVTTEDVNLESYEGVLINLDSVICTEVNTFWKVYDLLTDTCSVDQELYNYTPTLNQIYNITGIGTSYNLYKNIIPRDINDISTTCYDGVMNGNETDVDCGGVACSVCAVGIEENSLNNLLIYPNPTTGLFTIDLGNNAETVNYIITTIEGIIVEANKTTENIVEVDLTAESKGVYFLIIQENNTNTTYKIIKQ